MGLTLDGVAGGLATLSWHSLLLLLLFPPGGSASMHILDRRPSCRMQRSVLSFQCCFLTIQLFQPLLELNQATCLLLNLGPAAEEGHSNRD